jgi:aryl sulfotransferase
MTAPFPIRTRTYRSYGFDSRNWDLIVPRDGDIVITTSYKSGTTWMQNIVLRLVFQGRPLPAVSDVSPWIDRVHADPDVLRTQLAGQSHRRILKSHLALDGIPYRLGTRYIVVVRDARDVFMSLWNHMSNLTPQTIAAMNDAADQSGLPPLRIAPDIHTFWHGWINRGWFPWETEGYPHSSNLSHTQSWWDFRHLENIQFVHFNDLLANPAGEIARIATHLGIAVTASGLQRIVAETRFAALKANAAAAAPMSVSAADRTWPGGLATFFFKGTNNRWRDVLRSDELAMYERAKRRVLTPSCAAYIETGRKSAVLMLEHAMAGGFA